MKRAFTLLELLIVIGIIAILIAASTVGYATTQKKARDSRRKSDLKNIQTALEQYYSVCGLTYPAATSVSLPGGGSDTKVPDPIRCTSVAPTVTFMAPVPNDPGTAGAAGRYDMTGTGGDYEICAPNTPPMETESATQYCLKNQQ